MKTIKSQNQNRSINTTADSFGDLMASAMMSAANGHREVPVSDGFEMIDASELYKLTRLIGREKIATYGDDYPVTVGSHRFDSATGELLATNPDTGEAQSFEDQSEIDKLVSNAKWDLQALYGYRKVDGEFVKVARSSAVPVTSRVTLRTRAANAARFVREAGRMAYFSARLTVAVGTAVVQHGVRRGVEWVRDVTDRLALEARGATLKGDIKAAAKATWTMSVDFLRRLIGGYVAVLIRAFLLGVVLGALQRIPVEGMIVALGPKALQTALAYPRAALAFIWALRLTAGFALSVAGTVLAMVLVDLAVRGVRALVARIPVPVAA